MPTLPARHALLLCLSAALPLVISGCASMSEDPCRHADWAALGEQDARQGHARDHFSRRAAACERAGWPADAAAWRQGWSEGNQYFCQPQQGFRHGIYGHAYGQVCPPALESGFLHGYGLGLELHRMRAERNRLDREIAGLERRLEGADAMTADQAESLRRELDRLRREVRDVERGLGALETQVSMMGYGLPF